MEVVLEDAEGIPEGGVLSIKIGDMKRQAPAARIGQPFRFAAFSPADPLPLTVELLVPAAPAQAVRTDPAVPRFTVEFGGGARVTLQQRAAQELTKPAVDVAADAEAKGLPAEKLQTAREAAEYLKEHDLIRMFQEILHGLLVARPAEPLAYVEERLARARALAAAGNPPRPDVAGVPHGVSRDLGEDSIERTPTNSISGATKAARRQSIRQTLMDRGSVSINKVDMLLLSLQAASDNLPMVLPLIPEDLRQVLESKELAEECVRQFEALDTNSKGSLTPEDLMPIIEQLSSANSLSITTEQCRRFVAMFDTDEDETISLEEFTCLVQFVSVASFLESPEGKELVEMAMVEESNFKQFLDMIEKDKERLWTIVPFLPQWLVDHVTGPEFQDSCMKHFSSLDADQSGCLEPEELITVIQSLSAAHPLTIDADKCRQFNNLFDTSGKGFILKEEFIEFAQFLTIMNFLSNTSEGQRIKQRADLEQEGAKIIKRIAMLEADRNTVSEVLQEMPKALQAVLTAESFQESCVQAFEALDTDGCGKLDMLAAFPIICDVSDCHPFRVNQEQCRRYASFYDVGMTGVVGKDEIADLARFVILLASLYYNKDNQESLRVEVQMSQERIAELLKTLQEGVTKIAELVPFLPQNLMDELLSDDFSDQCIKDFKELDNDDSGVLEPKELLPVILQLAEAHEIALTDDSCRRFVEIFDAEGSGVITQREFVNFVRFMMIMAFMETEEGKRVSLDLEITKGQDAVEDLLRMLEQDRSAVHKVVPLLPKKVFDELTSDKFITSCREKFADLDTEGAGVLRPSDLYPVVVELSHAHPYAVSEDQCERFTKIFDLDGNAVLQIEEFLDFTRFLCVMSYLQTPEGKEASKDAVQVMSETKRIEELLDAMERDRGNVNKVLPYLPQSLLADLLSERFTSECLRFFHDLDKDGSGSLEPEELFPMVLALSEAHQQSLDLNQCRRFTAMFDHAKRGVINKRDFVEFSRFLIIMGYLKSQEGQEVLNIAMAASQGEAATPPQRPPAAAVKAPQERQPRRPAGPRPPAEAPPQLTIRHAGPEEAGAAPPLSPAASEQHLVVDCEFFQKKSSKLALENEALRDRMTQLEKLVRRMEERIEDQAQRLKHAEVDLRSSGLR